MPADAWPDPAATARPAGGSAEVRRRYTRPQPERPAIGPDSRGSPVPPARPGSVEFARTPIPPLRATHRRRDEVDSERARRQSS